MRIGEVGLGVDDEVGKDASMAALLERLLRPTNPAGSRLSGDSDGAYGATSRAAMKQIANLAR
jgi:hypothetical protein